MAILEKIASHILSFEKMSLIDKEKLKIAEETHYKLQKTKGKLHNITVYKNGGVNRASIYQQLERVNEDGEICRKAGSEAVLRKWTENVPQKLLKAKSEGLNSAL